MTGVDTSRTLAVTALALLFGLASAGAGAQQQAGMTPEQLQQALARAQGLLRQVAQQKAALEAELAGMRVENAGLGKKLRVTELRLEERSAELESSQRQGQRTGDKLERTEARLDKTRAQLEEVVAKYRELAAKQRDTEQQRATLKAELGDTQRELADAQERNRALYDTGRELLGLYDNKSGWEGLLQREPVTGLARVNIQNRLQEFEDALFDQLTDVNVERLHEGSAATPAE